MTTISGIYIEEKQITLLTMFQDFKLMVFLSRRQTQQMFPML